MRTLALIAQPVELLCVNIDEARQASKEGKIVKWRTAGELSEVIACRAVPVKTTKEKQ